METYKTTMRGCLLTAILLLCFAPTKACDLSNLSLLNVSLLPSGQYSISVRFCVGAGQTGTVRGADQTTGNFLFSLPSGFTFTSYPATVVSQQTGNTYTAVPNGNLIAFANNMGLPWACLQGCGPVQSVCYDFTFGVSGLPSSLTVLGAEGAGNINGGCTGPDMTVDPYASLYSLTLNATVTSPVCPSGSGSITLAPAGCTAPYSYAWSDGATTASRTGLAPGTYSVTVQDASLSCTQVATYTVNAAAPIAVELGANRTVYRGYSPQSCTTLSPTATGTAPFTYQWSTGSTASTLSVCPTTTTTYSVTMTDARGCTATDNIVVNAVDVRCGSSLNKVLICHNGNTYCVSSSQATSHLGHGDALGACNNKMDAQELVEMTLTAFPVPARDNINFEVQVPGTGNLVLEVYDLQGKLLSTQTTLAVDESELQAFTLDVSSWNAGTYIAKARHESGEMQAARFTVMH